GLPWESGVERAPPGPRGGHPPRDRGRSAQVGGLSRARSMAASLILVGIDFSDAAAMAVEEASRVARSVGGRVVGLHAPDGDGWGWTAEHREWAWQHGLDPADVVVRTGPPWLQLARYADEIRPGMVVVGSH